MGLKKYEGLIIDTHNDTMMKAVDPVTQVPCIDIGQDTNFNIDLTKMEKGNVNIAYFAAFTEDYGDVETNNHRILASINALFHVEKMNPGRFTVAKSFSQMMHDITLGKRIGVATIEGAYSINAANMAGLMKQYADLHVKAIAPVWNHSNLLGEGTYSKFVDETDSSNGLTTLGEAFVKTMSELNMMVDVSHMNEATFWDVVKHTKRPIIASHSGASGIKSHLRNLKDDQLLAIRNTGGVVNVVFCRYFLGDEFADLSVLIDHIEYIAALIGDEHVGLGSDFDGATMPVKLEDISRVPEIITGLRERNFSENAIANIMGNNNLRLLKSFDTQDQNRKRLELLTVPVILSNAQTIEWSLDSEMVGIITESITFLWDGILLKCHYNDLDKKIVAQSNFIIKQRYHVATIEFKDQENNIYFCTSISEFK